MQSHLFRSEAFLLAELVGFEMLWVSVWVWWFQTCGHRLNCKGNMRRDSISLLRPIVQHICWPQALWAFTPFHAASGLRTFRTPSFLYLEFREYLETILQKAESWPELWRLSSLGKSSCPSAAKAKVVISSEPENWQHSCHSEANVPWQVHLVKGNWDWRLDGLLLGVTGGEAYG